MSDDRVTFRDIQKVDARVRQLGDQLVGVQAELSAFTVINNMLALVADPKATAKCLADLQQRIDAATKAEAKLAVDRAAYEAKVAETTADLKAREEKVANRLFRAMRLEREPPVDPVDPDDRFPFNPNLLPGTRGHTGLARERGDEK